MQGDQSNSKAPLGNNYRPAQLVHHRVVRTNIDFNRSSVSNTSINLYAHKYFCIFIIKLVYH